MSQVNYTQMSEQELKQYLLTHKNDKKAFEAYIDRRHTKTRQVIITQGELEGLSDEEQVKLVEERLKVRLES